MTKPMMDLRALVKKSADADETGRRLMTIPGVGALDAAEILAAIGDPGRFRRARDVAACLGLSPRQRSPGGKRTLLGIAGRRSNDLRTLLLRGARSVMLHLDGSKNRLGNSRRPHSATGCRSRPDTERIAS